MSLRTVIVIQKLNENEGVDLAFVTADAANGMEFNNTGKAILFVKVEGTGSVTVQIPSRADLNERFGDVNQAVSGPAIRAFGPYGDASIFGDGVNLFVDFASVVGDVKVAAAQS
jgi:hypothetical protein